MATKDPRSIENLLNQGDWERARRAIKSELARKPRDHWLLTQLGVTFYEQGRYGESLPPLLASLEIVADCPLTLWNLAGALDALGEPARAIQIFNWLLRSEKTPTDDSCWESNEWTDALKTDCVYRIGICFQHLDRPDAARKCFHQYIDLLLAGRNGSYAVDDAARHIRELHDSRVPPLNRNVLDAITSTLQHEGIPSAPGKRPPRLARTLQGLLAT